MEHQWYIRFLERYARGRYSREDHLRFLEWFDRLADAEKERVLDLYYELSTSYNDDQTAGPAERLFPGIENRLDLLDQEPAKGRRFIIWARKYAALWLLVLLVPAAGYLSYSLFFSAKEMEVSRAAVEEDALPAGNKAVLTLSDGSEIILDETGRGKVAEQQGVLITKNGEGKLTYVRGRAGGTAGHAGGNPGNASGEANKTGGEPSPGAALSNTITTPRGGYFQVILPDGSTMWLNSASAVRYPATFPEDKREIELLYGEIYLKVVPSRRQGENPFMVVSSGQRIEVYGTEFNVKSYEDEATVTTTLIHGSIKLSLSDPPSSERPSKERPSEVTLKPGQSAVVARKPKQGNAAIQVKEADIEKAIAWKNGYFRFRNTPLYEIMDDLSRWYDIDVRYNGDFKNDRYTGYISRHVSLSNVLKIFSESGGLSFSLHDQVLEVSPGINRY